MFSRNHALIQSIMDPAKIAKSIIKNNIYLTLCTTDQKKPWASPLFYAETKDYQFYFISDKNSLHAHNIAKNPQVSVAIFNFTTQPAEVNGVQMEATAQMVTLKEIPQAIKTYFSKSGSSTVKTRFSNWKDPLSYLKLTTFRFYKIIPEKVYIINPNITKNDIRLKVEFT